MGLKKIGLPPKQFFLNEVPEIPTNGEHLSWETFADLYHANDIRLSRYHLHAKSQQLVQHSSAKQILKYKAN